MRLAKGTRRSMAKRTRVRRQPIRWSDAQIRKHASGALNFAMKREGAKQVDAASWEGVSDRTIHSAVRAKSIGLWILRSGRLRRHILEYLRVCDLKKAA